MSAIFNVINGRKYPSYVTEECLEFAINYKPNNEDLFLVSYPKSGSHWTYFISELIVNNGVYDDKVTGLRGESWIEYKGVNTILKPVNTSHLPYDLVPKNPLAKYLYVFRNPKDTVVSMYYHLNGCKHFDESFDFHQFFHQWICGEYNDYFVDVFHYWTHRLEGKSDYLVYEQMKRNPKKAILKIANFLGKEFVDKLLANNELVLNEVLNKTSFDFMKSNNSIKNELILRKGIVGDWRSYLTRDESDSVDKKFAEYFSGTELESIWSEDMKWQ